MSINVLYDADVVVVGAGSAGMGAALSAARTGARVALVEKSGVLGGNVVGGLVFMNLGGYDLDNTPTATGLIDEIYQRLEKYDATGGPMFCHGKPPWGNPSVVVPVNPYILSAVYYQMAHEENIKVFNHTMLADVVMDGNVLTGVRVLTKAGEGIIRCKAAVDASGEGDLFAKAGCSYVQGRESDGLCQPVTMYFRIGNVDVARIHGYLEAHPEDFRWWAIAKYSGRIPTGWEPNPIGFSGFLDAIARAKEAGELALGRETLNGFAYLHKGEVMANTTRVNFVDATNPQEVAQAEYEVRNQMLSFLPFCRKYLPGFEQAVILDSGTSLGVREARRLNGVYTITKDDCCEGREFDDVIGKNAYPVDIHNPHDSKSTWYQLKRAYEIPMRALMPRETANILVAGRCISSTHEAHASTRNNLGCFVTGEAAGVGTALCALEKKTIQELDIDRVQSVLVYKLGANLGRKFKNSMQSSVKSVQTL